MVKYRIGRIPVMVLLSLLFGCIQEVDNDIHSYDCFYASVEADEEDATRAHFEQSTVKWDIDDAIKVFSDVRPTLTPFTWDSSGKFNNSNGINGSVFYAFYPSSGVRSSSSLYNITFSVPSPAFNENSIRMPMVASGSGNNLRFKQTCGVLHFFIKGSGSYDKVTLSSNNGVSITGTGQVDLREEIPSFSLTGSKSPTINATVPSGVNWKSGVDIYFVVPPVTMSRGFTITVAKSGTNIKLSKSTDRSVSVLRRKMIRYAVDLDELAMNDQDRQPVDLGLSVKWAPFNVGATKPEEYGDYFAWGETEPYYEHGYSQASNPVWKSDKGSGYSWSSYIWCRGSSTTLIKYNTNRNFGSDVDNKTALDLEDDAAHANWGGSWRLPTPTEIQELIDNCKWTWTSSYGSTNIKGWVISSLKSGYTNNQIFLPAAGCRDESRSYNVGASGFYWTSSLHSSRPDKAEDLFFNSSGLKKVDNNDRQKGLVIRPVCGDYIFVESISIIPTAIDLFAGTKSKLAVSINPANASDKTIQWVSSNESVASVDDEGLVTARKAGISTITAISSNGKSSYCTVTVKAKPAPVYEAVDLGLSVKWATFNVGATKPEEYGDYFAWGETETYYEPVYAHSTDPIWKDNKNAGYDWSSYRWCRGNKTSLTKYNYESKYGTLDFKTALTLEDDVAHVNWGGGWRMPTREEIQELKDNCTVSETTQNGVKGIKMTSRIAGYTDKSIFFPAAGYLGKNAFSNDGRGYYFSMSLYTTTPFNAYYLRFNSNNVDVYYDERILGFSVRPVYGVFVPVSSVSINQSNIDLEPNATFQLSASIAPSNATAPGIRWVSSDESIASVNQSGIVTGISAGTATITAYASNGLSASCLFSISSGQIFSIESWELNPDLIVGAMDRLNKNRPASDAYYGNEPYKTYGGIGLYNPASEDDRTSLIAHFRNYSACWKNANVESSYTFKVINYKNTIVDIVGSGTNTSFGADANGCAFVTMPGADLKGMAEQTLLSPDILFRKPDGLQAGKDVLIEVSERINGQEMKGYYYLVPNAVSRNQIEFTGQGAELGAFHDSNDYILVHELMPIIYKNGKEIIKWNSSSQSWTITSEGQSLGLKDAGLISVRINFLIFDKNEKDSEDSFKGRLSIFEPGDYITPYPYPVRSVSEAGINWWDGDLTALMSDKVAGYKMAVYYYGLDNPLVTTIEGEVKVLASGKKAHPYHRPDGTWWY